MTGNRGERRRRQDEIEILDAALALFAAQGFHGTSMQQIAGRAEFSVGKIYTLFPSKEALLRTLQERAINELHAAFAARVDDDMAPLLALHATLREAFDFASEQLQLIRLQVAEKLGRPQQAEQSVIEMFRDRTRRLLDRAIATGELRPVDTGLLATMIVGAGSALVDDLAASDGADPFKDIPDRIMDLMVRPHLARPEANR
ncbi:MAG: TetR/AcrR family transcriptional regulator [bacterium]|nr:TetR/AcrR family transcriptional regulator [bacterium]